MPRGKRAASGSPSDDWLPICRHVLSQTTMPPQLELLGLWVELKANRLDYLALQHFPRSSPGHSPKYAIWLLLSALALTTAAKNEEAKASAAVSYETAMTFITHGNRWLYMRDELVKFVAVAVDELAARAAAETKVHGKPASPPTPVVRDTKADARDKWMHRLATKDGETYRAIMLKLKRMAESKGWRKLDSPTAVQQAINRYIDRKKLAPLPRRKQA